MDSHKTAPKSSDHNITKPLPQPHDGRCSSSLTAENVRGATRTGDNLRRLHSDGNGLSGRPRLRHHTLSSDIPRGETWMDFLRNSDAGSLPEEQAQIITRKAAIVAADRKRRFAGQQEEYSRRRSNGHISSGQSSSERMRQNLSLSRTVDAPGVTPRSLDNSTRQRMADRPLPPRPGTSSSQNIHSRDIRPPAWQPDIEVSDCPICGHRFNFWYRKHHCRKCGRVVCANCSPHRITIPRQFIVYPPSSSDESFDTGATPISAIDLTGDDEDEAPGPLEPHGSNRWQNRDNWIDPALGGGQEVRLCNPCVPDPNPSPHLPFTPPSRYNSFSAPENPARAQQGQTNPSHHNQQRLSLAHGIGPDHPLVHLRNATAVNVNTEGEPTSSPFTGPSTSTRRQSRNTVRDDLSNYPPNYSLIYGSAPDPSFHERYPSSILQEDASSRHRHRHRHHASASYVPSSSRPPSIPNVDNLIRSRAASQPVIREEDECPICHGALPPKDPDGSEAAREAHVVSCIESHFQGPSPQISRSHATANIPAGADEISARANGSPFTIHADSLDAASISASLLRPRRRTTGMIVYLASEKDCVGEDGERPQECVICFEEFAVGDEMGRLECLCKYHKRCIRQWWDTKGPGSCPVHQGGL